MNCTKKDRKKERKICSRKKNDRMNCTKKERKKERKERKKDMPLEKRMIE